MFERSVSFQNFKESTTCYLYRISVTLFQDLLYKCHHGNLDSVNVYNHVSCNHIYHTCHWLNIVFGIINGCTVEGTNLTFDLFFDIFFTSVLLVVESPTITQVWMVRSALYCSCCITLLLIIPIKEYAFIHSRFTFLEAGQNLLL